MAAAKPARSTRRTPRQGFRMHLRPRKIRFANELRELSRQRRNSATAAFLVAGQLELRNLRCSLAGETAGNWGELRCKGAMLT